MQKVLALTVTTLLLFGLTCPASFVLGLEVAVFAVLIAQLKRFPVASFSFVRGSAAPLTARFTI